MFNQNVTSKEAKVVAISNRKGGSGKTTTSVNLSSALAHKGNSVLLIDADPQGHSSLSLGKPVNAQNADLSSLLNGQASLDEVVRITYLRKLKVLPGGSRLTAFERDNAKKRASRTIFSEKIQPARKKFDYIIIDTPPTLSPMTISALIASTDVLVPMQAHFLAMEGLAEMIKIIKVINKLYNKELSLMGVVPTFFQQRTRLSEAIIKDLVNTLGQSKILHPVRINIALAEAPSHGKSIFQYKLKSNGAYDYLSLANQIEALE